MRVGILRLSAIVLCGLAVAWTSGAYAQPKELSVWTMGGDQPAGLRGRLADALQA